ncbi:hypothetical protein ACE1B6_24175 [Aerosakkonemataceae cyanobacterium BLCC-F154]|uniref:Uncharacterized protein n=1 Tax=Floridaenema fluviatile BLCC-F154 TaxID=3153640 RepID=A0ABV4YIN3_9CYAN
MLVLVVGNDIAGETDSKDNLPEGFRVFEFDRMPLNNLYFDGEKIQVIPEKPSDNAYWTGKGWAEDIPDKPKIEKASEDPVFAAIYGEISGISPVIADTLAYFIARYENNVETQRLYREKLREHAKNKIEREKQQQKQREEELATKPPTEPNETSQPQPNETVKADGNKNITK